MIYENVEVRRSRQIEGESEYGKLIVKVGTALTATCRGR